MKVIKYCIIVIISIITNKTVISVFGATYAISGNIVKKLGDNQKS